RNGEHLCTANEVLEEAHLIPIGEPGWIDEVMRAVLLQEPVSRADAQKEAGKPTRQAAAEDQQGPLAKGDEEILWLTLGRLQLVHPLQNVLVRHGEEWRRLRLTEEVIDDGMGQIDVVLGDVDRAIPLIGERRGALALAATIPDFVERIFQVRIEGRG